MPVEPPPTTWRFPSPENVDEPGLVAVGGDLEPGTVLAAYRRGLFPMPVAHDGPIGWWSPDPRAIIPLDGLRVSRSLRRSVRRFEVRVDTAFSEVLAACAAPSRYHGWIDQRIIDAYKRLAALGWVHSVEVWDDEGRLAGGLYGVAIGGFFAGESMFHRERDASKVALVHLVDLLHQGDPTARLLDVQWMTPHLSSLGAVEVPRARYLELLADALLAQSPPSFGEDPLPR